MRPTTIISLVVSALLGLGGIALSIFLLLDRQSGVKWHYWLAPFMMIGAAAMLLQLTALYMKQIGRREMRSHPPRID